MERTHTTDIKTTPSWAHCSCREAEVAFCDPPVSTNGPLAALWMPWPGLSIRRFTLCIIFKDCSFFEGVDHIMEPIRSTLTSHDPPGNHGEGGVFNTQAGAQQNENVNLKSKGCCGAVSDGFMPVASAGRLGAFSSMWWAVVRERTTVQPEGLLLDSSAVPSYVPFMFSASMPGPHSLPCLCPDWKEQVVDGSAEKCDFPTPVWLESGTDFGLCFIWVLQRWPHELAALDKVHV